MTLTDHIEGELADYDLEYRVHASRRMFQRDIAEDDVEILLRKGRIIERYDEDFPFPSFLLNGIASTGRPLHVVTAINLSERKLIIITAYEPDSAKWVEDYSRRL